MFPGVRSSLVFSGFGLKPPASGFQSYSYRSLKTSPSVTSKVVPSVLAFVCWSLQCLISALTQGGGGGHFLGSLVQSCCGEGGTLPTNNTGVCSQCLSHTGFVPTHGACALPAHTAQALGCSASNCLRLALGCMHLPGISPSGSGTRVVFRGADSVGLAFCALPRSEQLV